MVDDKFIMMNLNDEKSKKVAEVLKSDTCKKILDYLAENKERSEEDISKDLGMPINTIEYNLKKLLDSGLVDKSKNFFWSKRGKKINLYKPANRHIVISPRKRPNMDVLKTILPVILGIALVVVLALTIPGQSQVQSPESNDAKTFSSLSDLKNFLKENQQDEGFYGVFGRDVALESGAPSPNIAAAESADASESGSQKSGASAEDYSETNIQVEDVDEADIVKNDGKYIYIVSGKKVVIVNAFPAESMEILSNITLEDYPIDIFLNGDKLVVFSNSYSGSQKTNALVYDITNRENPELESEFEIGGNYLSSRMIGDYVYLISNQYTYFDDIILPMLAVDGVTKEIPATDIAYFPQPDTSYTFTNILAFNVKSGEYETQTYLTGASYTVYVSENNIYLTYTKTISQQTYFEEMTETVIVPLLPSGLVSDVQEIMASDKQYYEKSQEVSLILQDYSDSLRGSEKSEFDSDLQEKMQKFFIDLQKRSEQTVVHKIEIDGLEMSYITNGEVPGHLLNQFSMDEDKGYFRIATTTGNTWGSSSSLNNMYVLDENLETVGSVEDLAKGESIYSVRFMGDRAYMVTFRQVDPLFVIDLSNPESPEVLGQLKVTGFSNYLHPYDENHVIGIGKEASEQGRAQGLNIALFDVSDVSNPIEKAKYEVKQQWSDSNALYDHKAFLFDKERELLVLPVTYSEPTGEVINQWGRYWNYNYWQGAFVFRINQDEISLRGKIDHAENESENYYYNYAVQRSLFMDDTLYTISQKMVKANDLSTLSKISSVDLPFEEQIYYYADSVKGSTGVGFAEAGVSVDAPVPDGAVA